MSDPVGIPVPVALTLESGAAKLTVSPPTAIPTLPIVSYVLYSAPTAAGPWTQLGYVPFPEISAYATLYDTNVLYGHTTYYAAAAIRSDGVASALSAPLAIAPLHP